MHSTFLSDKVGFAVQPDVVCLSFPWPFSNLSFNISQIEAAFQRIILKIRQVFIYLFLNPLLDSGD